MDRPCACACSVKIWSRFVTAMAEQPSSRPTVHTGTFLFWGRNEECGLRCTYHGWKFDADGNCVDMPNEPAESNFKDKVKLRSYPIREWAGLISICPDPMKRPRSYRSSNGRRFPPATAIYRRGCKRPNWLQGLEGSRYVACLAAAPLARPRHHARVSERRGAPRSRGPRRVAALDRKRDQLRFFYGGRRPAGNDDAGQYYWRVIQWLLPTYSLIPSPQLRNAAGRCWIPSTMNTPGCFPTRTMPTSL